MSRDYTYSTDGPTCPHCGRMFIPDAERAETTVCQDAEDIVRLKEALGPFAAYADVKGGTPDAEALRQVVYAICETPYPDNMTALHEFCVACRNASDALACRPQEKPHGA